MRLPQYALVLNTAVHLPTASASPDPTSSGEGWLTVQQSGYSWHPTGSPTPSSHYPPSGYPTPSTYPGGGGETETEAKERAAAVVEAFEHAWSGYYSYAFPNDELLPVNNNFSNSRNGWGASAADALSTALIMDLPDIYNVILAHIPTIDWSVSYEDEQVSLFETTIRYLGGILSAYDLLSGPLSYGQHDVRSYSLAFFLIT